MAKSQRHAKDIYQDFESKLIKFNQFFNVLRTFEGFKPKKSEFNFFIS